MFPILPPIWPFEKLEKFLESRDVFNLVCPIVPSQIGNVRKSCDLRLSAGKKLVTREAGRPFQFVQYALGLVKAGTRKARLILDEGSVGAFNSVVCNMDYGSMSVMRSLAVRRMHKIRRMHETRQSHLGIGSGQRLV